MADSMGIYDMAVKARPGTWTETGPVHELWFMTRWRDIDNILRRELIDDPR